MKKEKVFRVQLVYDKLEKKLGSVVLREVSIPAIPICDPDQVFPTKIIDAKSQEVRFADIIVYGAEPSKHPREITLLKGGKKK
jgi:hypothetical protein